MKTLNANTDGMIGSAVTRHAPVRKVLLTCGILSSLLYVAATILGARAWEGYNSIVQPVSELSAIGAPSQSVMGTLGFIYSLLTLAFGFGVLASANGQRSLRIIAGLLIGYGVACLAAPLAPMHQRGVAWSLTDTLHLVFAGVDVLFILLLLVCGVFTLGKGFRLYSLATILVGLVSGVFMGVDASRFGLWERINIYAFLVWIMALAIALLRSPEEQESMPQAASTPTRVSAVNR